jgi:hypothetical protein
LASVAELTAPQGRSCRSRSSASAKDRSHVAPRVRGLDYPAAMIERVVLIALRPEFTGEAQLESIAETTITTLRGAEGVRDLRVAIAADARTRRDWHLCIEVVLDDLEAVERYRVDRVHRAYADAFLKPMLARIRVYNFDRVAGGTGAVPSK